MSLILATTLFYELLFTEVYLGNMFCWLWRWQWGRNWIKSWYAKGPYRPEHFKVVPSIQPETWFFTWTFFWKSWKTDELVTGSSPFEWLLITYRIMAELQGLLKIRAWSLFLRRSRSEGIIWFHPVLGIERDIPIIFSEHTFDPSLKPLDHHLISLLYHSWINVWAGGDLQLSLLKRLFIWGLGPVSRKSR